MIDEKNEKRLRDATLASVVKEMAKPRLASSARKAGGSFMTIHSLFRKGDLLHNHATKEDGSVRRVYKKDGLTMYEVWVPKRANSWKRGHDISNWAECVLDLSCNDRLMDSGDDNIRCV
jgi:hypothetical protein